MGERLLTYEEAAWLIARYLAVFVVALTVFLSSPVIQLADSTFSILLSESVLTRHTNDLTGYRIPGLDVAALPAKPDLLHSRDFYQLVRINGKVLYYYPHGSALLSLPLVAVLRGLGSSVVWLEGSYDKDREAQEQVLLAGFLMAVLACVFLRTAEIMLPASWSWTVAIGASFGTQIWSTASRALWSHTWEILLLAVVVLELLGAQQERRRLHVIWLASLISWMFFVRPTGGLVVAGVTGYIFLYRRTECLPYVLTGLTWLVGFSSYGWFTFGQVLPGYYHHWSALSTRYLLVALAGSFVSPSRGLFVFVPEVLLVAFLVIRYWRDLIHRRLVVLAIAVSCVHMLILSCDVNWWGGHSYGARLSTDLVPWFVLLAILSLRAFRDDVIRTSITRGLSEPRLAAHHWAVVAVAFLLLALGVAINGRGAWSVEAQRWNGNPNIDVHPERVWDWRAPQFLAGLAWPR